MFSFITKKPLWANILFALVVLFAVLFLFLVSLNWITNHGSTKTIPNVTGKKMQDAVKLLEDQGFEVIIQDSIYNDTIAPLQVVKQFPEADASVKINRDVYLTITRAVAPTIDMPNLVGLSIRSAELVLKQYGLKLGDTSFRPDFAKNSVLAQQFNGQEIVHGSKIKMGSRIDLVLGSGLTNEDMAVPDMVGMTYAEAKTLMESYGLSFGSVVPRPGITDTASAFIYEQRPGRYNDERKVNRIRSGQMIDVFLQTEKQVIDSMHPKPVTTDY